MKVGAEWPGWLMRMIASPDSVLYVCMYVHTYSGQTPFQQAGFNPLCDQKGVVTHPSILFLEPRYPSIKSLLRLT